MSKVTKQVDLIVKGYSDMGGVSGVASSLEALANRANARLSQSILDFRGAGAEATSQLVRVAQVAYIELRRIARSEDVRIGVKFAKEKAEAGLKSLAAMAANASRSLGVSAVVSIATDRAKSQLEDLEVFARVMTGKVVRGLRLDVATDKIKSKLENVEATARVWARKIDTYFRGHALTFRVGDRPFQIAAQAIEDRIRRIPGVTRAARVSIMAVNGVSRVASEAYNALGPIRRLAQRGITVTVRAVVAGGLGKLSIAVNGISGAFGQLRRLATSTFGLVTGGLAAMGIAASGIQFARLLSDTARQIDTTTKLADRLGIATEKLSAYQYGAKQAGIEFGAFESALEQMLRRTADAADGSDALSMSFKRIGIDAASLANMPTDEAFVQIADGISKIGNESERASIAMDIFGRGGQDLLPMLSKGAAGMKQVETEAKRLGLSFNRVDAAKIELANDAMERLSAVGQGALQTLAIQLAPVVESIANHFVDAGTSGEGMSARVVNAFGWVMKAVGKAADYLELLNAGWQSMRGVASYAIGGVLEGISLVIRGIEWLNRKLGIADTHFGEDFQKFADEVLVEGQKAFEKAGESWDNFWNETNSKKAAREFDGIQSAANQAAKSIADAAEKNRGKPFIGQEQVNRTIERANQVTEILNRLANEAATAGLSDIDRQLRELEQLGATAEQIAQARGAMLAAQNVEEIKSLEEEAKRITESVRTPTEKLKNEMDNLRALFSRGLVDEETVRRSVEAAYKDITPEKVQQAIEVQLPSFSDNFNAFAQVQKEQGMKFVDPLLDINQEMLATQREILNATIERGRSSVTQTIPPANTIVGNVGKSQQATSFNGESPIANNQIVNVLNKILTVLEMKQKFIPVVSQSG